MSTIVVTEDVTGPAYEQLSARWGLDRDPEAWNSPDRMRDLLRDLRWWPALASVSTTSTYRPPTELVWWSSPPSAPTRPA